MPKRSFKIPVFAVLTSLFVLFFLTGCGSANKSTTESSKDTSVPTVSSPVASSSTAANNNTPSSPHSVTLTLYFPNTEATGLIPVVRTVQVKDEEVIKAMFAELANPPAGLEQPLPKGTILLGATVKDGVAAINLSPEFQKNFGGGSASEQMTIFSIVDTLTTLPNVHSVQFLLNGQKNDAILGGLDTSVPIPRNESLIISK